VTPSVGATPANSLYFIAGGGASEAVIARALRSAARVEYVTILT